MLRIFSFAILLSSCAPKIHFNLDLVRPYTFELEIEKHLEAPYIAEYSKGKKKLIYLAANHFHSSPTRNGMDHPTNKTIAKIYELHHPQVVIVEGMPYPGVKSPKELWNIKDDCSKVPPKDCAESAVGIKFAIETKTEFITGEPSDKEIADFLISKGFTREDLLGFYMVRQIPQLPGKGIDIRVDTENVINLKLKGYRKRAGFEGEWLFQDFEKWYASKNLKKNYRDTNYNDTAPNCAPDGTFIQKISCQVGYMRDRNIVQVIENMLNEYDRVLIVYGGSHLMIDEPALIDALGTAEYTKYY